MAGLAPSTGASWWRHRRPWSPLPSQQRLQQKPPNSMSGWGRSGHWGLAHRGTSTRGSGGSPGAKGTAVEARCWQRSSCHFPRRHGLQAKEAQNMVGKARQDEWLKPKLLWCYKDCISAGVPATSHVSDVFVLALGTLIFHYSSLHSKV